MFGRPKFTQRWPQNRQHDRRVEGSRAHLATRVATTIVDRDPHVTRVDWTLPIFHTKEYTDAYQRMQYGRWEGERTLLLQTGPFAYNNGSYKPRHRLNLL